MFVALEIQKDTQGGFFRTLTKRLRRQKMWTLQDSCMGKRFAVLRCIGDKPIDWEAVEEICGVYRNRLLLPEGVDLPEDTRLEQPVFSRFRSVVLTATACQLVAQTRMQMYKRTLGFIDIKGNYPGLLRQLLRYYTTVRVVTGETDFYRDVSDKMMEEFGAPVLVSDSLDSLDGCVLVLCPDDLYISQELPFSCPVLTGGVFVAPGQYHLINGARVMPEEAVRNACPPGIDLQTFMGALYELCGVEFSSYVAGELLFDYRVSTLYEAAKMIADWSSK